MSKLNKHCNTGKTHFATVLKVDVCIKKTTSILAVRFYEYVHSLTLRKDNEEEENKVIKSEL
jgi:DNA replication protein DnaC